MKKIKFLILGLFCLFGLISFSNAGILSFTGTIPTDGNAVRYYFEEGNNICDFYVSCVFTNSSTFYFTFLNSYKDSNGTNSSNSMGSQVVYKNNSYITHIVNSDCSGMRSIGLSRGDGSDFECFIYGGDVSDVGNSSCPECQECEICPEVDTGSILSGYIAISDITDNYCISNGLCGEISTGMSTLYINDIRHESKPFIYINIPDYLDWDYTGDVAQMFVNVNGYNTDADYMQSIIDINSYRPTSDDFTSIFVSGLTLIFPYLIFALFIVFMRKLIKRIFKH